MQLSKEEYARKRIHNGSVQIENSVTRVTVRHHSASLVKPNSYPRDGIFNQHLTNIKDSYTNTRAAYRPALSSPNKAITVLNRTEKHETKEHGKTQHESSRSKNHNVTQNKNYTRTTALEQSLA